MHRPRGVRSATQGLTLFELLVVMSLLGALLGALSVSSLIGGKFFHFSEEYIHVQQQARQALASIVRDVREGAGTTVVTGAGQVTFQVALGYNLPAPCPANQICLGAKDQTGANQPGWRVRYRLNGTQLLREILNAGSVVQPGTRVLANDVSQLTFIYPTGTNTMTVQLQVQRVSGQLPGGSLSAGPTPLVTRVRLRNP